jgi:hypothetical protein
MTNVPREATKSEHHAKHSGGSETLAWINVSKKSLSDADAARIVEALNLQAPSVAQAWSIPVNSHLLAANADSVPAGAVKAYFLPNADIADALGYHDVDPEGDPYIRVFVDTVLQNGGTVLSGAVSVSVCAAHEAAEEAVDPQCSSYSGAEPDGNKVAIEVADPVEENSYQVSLSDGTSVDVTDFVFPAFFDPTSPGPFDQLGLVSQPFEILKGGYEIVENPAGKVSQVFGEDYSKWRDELRRSKRSRTYRRLHP